MYPDEWNCKYPSLIQQVISISGTSSLKKTLECGFSRDWIVGANSLLKEPVLIPYVSTKYAHEKSYVYSIVYNIKQYLSYIHNNIVWFKIQ